MICNDISVYNFFVIYFSLFLIGAGPSLFLLRNVYSTSICFLVWSPVIALMFVTLIGTSLVFSGIPVLFWAKYLLYFAAGVSLVMTLFLLGKSRSSSDVYFLKKNDIVCFFGIGIITLAFLILPLLFGGIDFVFSRGNAADSIGYMNMADTWNHIPYDLNISRPEKIKNPTYFAAIHMFRDRGVTVSILMALFADWLGERLYNFEYAFSLIFLALAYPPSFLLGLQLKIKPLVSAIFASLVSIGFWATFILDNRSQSHLSSIAILICLVLLLSTINSKNNVQCRKECILFFLFSSVLFILYIEMTPFLALAFFLLISLEISKRSAFLKPLLYYCLLPLLGIFLAYLLNYIFFQTLIADLEYADHGINDWYKYGFVWLYDNLLTGVWGLGLSTEFFELVSFVLGSALNIFLLRALFFSFTVNQKNNAILVLRCISCIVISGLLAFTYLFAKHQLWAAGKALSYIYPFLLILPIFAVFSSVSRIKTKKLKFICQLILMIYFLFQWCFAGIRVEHALTQTEYSNRYMTFNPHYRYFNWHVAPLEKKVLEHCSTLSLDMEQTSLYWYLSLVFNDKISTENFSSNTIYKKGDCIVVDKNSLLPLSSYQILIKNKDVTLITSF